VPRIDAPTVAEHRAQQHEALLDAARDLLLDGGWAALSFSALARRTGLARPTVYSYFRTKEDVVLALCKTELPLVAAEIAKAVRQAANPRDQVAAFVRAQLRAAQQRPYRIAHTLVTAPLSAPTRQAVVALHRELTPTAAPLFARLGHPHPELAARLLQGLINSAVLALSAGEPARRVARVTVAAALDGLGQLAEDQLAED